MKFKEGTAAQIVVPDGKRDVLVFDAGLPGFGIRKFASGKASYLVKYEVGAKQRRLTLGKVIPGNLTKMRKLASEILAKARAGKDTVAETRAAAAAVARAAGTTLAALVPVYLEQKAHRVRPRYLHEVHRQLTTDFKSLHHLTAADVNRQQVRDAVDAIARRGKVAADRARVSLSGFFRWAIEAGHCEHNPTGNIAHRSSNASRHRVLPEAELAEVWRAAEGMGDYGKIVQLLVLTGQRREEIGGLRWSEIDLGGKMIELPPERTKNHWPHIIPLSDQAMAILASIERQPGSDFVFGRRAGAGFGGYSRGKALLDGRVSAAQKAKGVKKELAPWVVHDLRRSFVTRINESGIAPPHVVEALVNHISGHLAGVAGVYNRAQYLEERQKAMAAWGDRIEAMLADHGAVVQFPARAVSSS